MGDRQWRPGREVGVGGQAHSTGRKGIPGKKTLTEGLRRRAHGPAQRPRAQPDGIRGNAVGSARGGTVVRLRHVATSAGVLAVRARAPGATGLRADVPSAQLMVAVEPAGSAESMAEDGAAYLNARQHLLLNLFGVTPRALHPGTGLALAEALDALEAVARSAAGADATALPASAGEHRLATSRWRSSRSWTRSDQPWTRPGPRSSR